THRRAAGALRSLAPDARTELLALCDFLPALLLHLACGRRGVGGLLREHFLGALPVDTSVVLAGERADRLDDCALLVVDRAEPAPRRLDQRALDDRRRAVLHQRRDQRFADLELGDRGGNVRSEEHTSELQSRE